MNVYVDIRCLQDENYAFRGVGYHSAVLLKSAKEYLPIHTKLIGLVDPQVGALPTSFLPLFDSIETVFASKSPSAPAAFLEMSPMTHDPMRVTRLLGRHSIFSATIIYDFIPFDVPERYLSNPANAEEYSVQLSWLPAYDVFFPISEYSGRRVQEILAIPTDRVFTTGVALRPEFELVKNGATFDRPSTTKLKLPEQFVVCVAGADRRKNVELLLESHAKLPSECKELHLVVVGKYSDSHIGALAEIYRQAGGSTRKLHVLQGLSDAELTIVYQRASLSVCASQIEGFSLPVIEAIACKCPILVSDNAAHLELVGNPNAIFGTEDALRLTNLIVQTATNPETRLDILRSQSDSADRFAAKQVCDLFWKPICNGIRKTAARQRNVSRHALLNRPRIAILSPFPPEASGVADYTRRTVQELGKRADVDVYTGAENPTPTREVKNFFPLSEIPFTSGQYDNTLTVVGNSHFHTQIINLQRTFGGPCLIHDNRLAELYNWWKGQDYLAEMATKHLGRKVTGAEVQHWMSNPGDLPSMFFCELIDSATPLIVHSRGIQAQCLKEHAINPAYLPFCCYREFDVAQLSKSGQQSARNRLGIPHDQLMVISLGIVASTKGPEPCIKAIQLLHDSGQNAHLYFVGSAGTMRESLISFAGSLGIESLIHFSGEWVSEGQYQDYILAADAAIQLRNHFFGGLSGAMLDCIASGLMTVANDDLAEALDSPEFVSRISDSLQATEIHEALLDIFTSKTYGNRLQSSRTQYIEEHSFDRYAEKLLDVLGVASSASTRHRARNVHSHPLVAVV